MLAGWCYYKEITIQGSSNAGTDYQVLLKVGESSGSSGCDFHLDGHSEKFPSDKDDGGDLRFTDTSDNLLPFWVEKVEGTSPNRVAYVWVKVSADLSSDQTIRIYYGNPNAENVSNADDSFEFFDDFTSSGYTMIRGSSSQVSVSNGKLRIDATSGYSSENDIIVELNNSMSLSGNYSIEGNVYLEKPDEWIGWFTEDGSGKGYTCGWYGWSGTEGSIERWDGWNAQHVLEPEIPHYIAPQGSTQNLRWDRVGNEVRLWDTDGSKVIKTSSDSTYNSFSKVAIRAFRGSIWQVDWVFVRKYTDPEPAFKSASSEFQSNTITIVSDKAIIQDNSAQLIGNLTCLGGNSEVNVWFEWGQTTSYENTTPQQTLTQPQTFSAILNNLSEGVVYHFRACASKTDGTDIVYGADKAFVISKGNALFFAPNF